MKSKTPIDPAHGMADGLGDGKFETMLHLSRTHPALIHQYFNASCISPCAISRTLCARGGSSRPIRHNMPSRSGWGTPSSCSPTICPLRKLIESVSGPEVTNNLPDLPLNASIFRIDWRPNVCKSPSMMRSCCSIFSSSFARLAYEPYSLQISCKRFYFHLP